MTDDRTTTDGGNGSLDPGAYIGSQPEREAETIPGGVQPGEFDPLTQASDEVGPDEVAEVTPTLGGPLPD